jgi:hypothetical protein
MIPKEDKRIIIELHRQMKPYAIRISKTISSINKVYPIEYIDCKHPAAGTIREMNYAIQDIQKQLLIFNELFIEKVLKHFREKYLTHFSIPNFTLNERSKKLLSFEALIDPQILFDHITKAVGDIHQAGAERAISRIKKEPFETETDNIKLIFPKVGKWEVEYLLKTITLFELNSMELDRNGLNPDSIPTGTVYSLSDKFKKVRQIRTYLNGKMILYFATVKDKNSYIKFLNND